MNLKLIQAHIYVLRIQNRPYITAQIMGYNTKQIDGEIKMRKTSLCKDIH